MAFVPKITVSEFVEREISIRYKRLPIVNFVNLIKSGVELGKFERYVIEFFREVKPENRRKFMVEQNITPFEMEQLYNKVKHIPAVSTVEGSIYGECVNVNIRMYNFDDVQCTVIPSVAYGFVTGMNLQLC